MVAYSFRKRFVDPIRHGLLVVDKWGEDARWVPKRQTIRADRKRHARPGEEIQLYCGMRTRQCFLIGRVRCTSIEPIRMRPSAPIITIGADDCTRTIIQGPRELTEFARNDGFADWAEMVAFWRQEHPLVLGAVFQGVIIKWEPLT